jgi:hypothetical protein
VRLRLRMSYRQAASIPFKADRHAISVASEERSRYRQIDLQILFRLASNRNTQLAISHDHIICMYVRIGKYIHISQHARSHTSELLMRMWIHILPTADRSCQAIHTAKTWRGLHIDMLAFATSRSTHSISPIKNTSLCSTNSFHEKSIRSDQT